MLARVLRVPGDEWPFDRHWVANTSYAGSLVVFLSVAILAHVGIQPPSLSSSCICHLAWPLLKGWLHQVRVRSQWWNMVQSWEEPCHVQCRTCGKTLPRPNVTLSTSCPPEEIKKEMQQSKCSCNVSTFQLGFHVATRRANRRYQMARIQSWKIAVSSFRDQ